MIKSILKKTYLVMRTVVFQLVKIIIRRNIPPFPDEVKSILIACQERVGDTIMTLPSLAALRSRFPGAEIICLADEYVCDLIDASGTADKTLPMKGFLINDLVTMRKSIPLRPDLAIDMQTDYTLRNALLLAFSGAIFTIGYDVHGRGVFYNKPLRCPPSGMHTVDCLLQLSKETGAGVNERQPVLHLPDSLSASIRRILIIYREDENKGVVGIHPGGHYWTQRWPQERFAETADELIGRCGYKVVLTGAPGEKGLLYTIKSLMTYKAEVFITENIHELMEIISQCKVLICNNSGPLHVSTALAIPTVSTMGPTLASRWWPLGKNNIVLRKELSCISCNNGYCRIGTHECMNAISVQEVIDAVKTLIRGSKQGT